MIAKYNAQSATATKKIPLELLTGLSPRPSWQEADERDEVEEVGSADEDDSESVADVKCGQTAGLGLTTRRQLADKRCPELERVGIAQWKRQSAVFAFLEASDTLVECKELTRPTAFRKIKPARVQQQAATEFRCSLGNQLTDELLESLDLMDSQLQSLQQEFQGQGTLSLPHLRIAARVQQLNVFVVEPASALQQQETRRPRWRPTRASTRWSRSGTLWPCSRGFPLLHSSA